MQLRNNSTQLERPRLPCKPFSMMSSSQMFYLTILGLVSLLGLFFQLVSDNDRGRRFQLPPGPKPVWWLGNIWTFRKLNTSPSATCIELASKWGEMTTVWVGSCPAILINNPQAAHDLLHKVRKILSPNSIQNLLFPDLSLQYEARIHHIV